jgi:hypothetical protein
MNSEPIRLALSVAGDFATLSVNLAPFGLS